MRKLLFVSVIAAFSLVGVLLLINSRAATPFISSEAETGTIGAPAAKVSDAAASGGAALKFMAPPPVVLPGQCPIGISHRGYIGTGSTENSIGAFNATFAAKINWLEIDIRFTEDGVPVIMHDADVERTTTGTGKVANLSLAQFRARTLNDGQTPPTLEEVLALVRGKPDRKILAEFKASASAAQQKTVLAQLKGLEKQVYLQGFAERLSTLEAMEAANPALHTSLLARNYVATMPASLNGQNIQYSQVTAAVVSSLQAKGLSVGSWTPDDVASWRKLKAAKVNSIIIDNVTGYAEWMAGGCK